MVAESNELTFTDSEMKLLREKYARLTDTEFEAFLAAAARYRLNPLANQIYARLQEQTQKNPRAVTFMTQIDGYRLIADRTGCYAGNDDPTFDSETKPTKATTAVYKLVGGQRAKFEASARWSQYCPGGNAAFMWQKMPHLMLGKCAEALALRKAFPAELSGLYTVDEMQQADGHEPHAPAANGKSPEPAAPTPFFAPPVDWPNTPLPELLAWIGKIESIATLAVALGLLAHEPGLYGTIEEWEPALVAVGNRYKQLTAGFADRRDRAIEEKIRGHLEKLALDKAGAEVFGGHHSEEQSVEI